MRIEQLETLVEVADRASMHKAADSLHTSVQNVSKQIKQLETDLDISLFTRNNSGVFLTSDGEFVYEKARDILDLVEEISDRYSKTRVITSNESYEMDRCDILSSYSSQRVATKLLNKLDKRIAIASSALISSDAAIINRKLADEPESVFENYELAFTHFIQEEYGQLEPLFDKCQVFKLDRLGLAVHVSCDNPLAQRKSISLREIIDQPLVFSINDSSTHVENALLSYGVKIKPRYRFNAGASADYYISQNMGYGLRPFSSSLPEEFIPPNTVIIPLKERVVFTQIVVISPNISNSYFLKSVLELLKKMYPGMAKLS